MNRRPYGVLIATVFTLLVLLFLVAAGAGFALARSGESEQALEMYRKGLAIDRRIQSFGSRAVVSSPAPVPTGGEQVREMAEACRGAKIEPPIGFHGLRHTWASLAVMGGTPLIELYVMYAEVAKLQAELANSSKSRFLASMSHELQNSIVLAWYATSLSIPTILPPRISWNTCPPNWAL